MDIRVEYHLDDIASPVNLRINDQINAFREACAKDVDLIVDQDQAVIRIADTGVGIPPERMDTLFFSMIA